MNTAASTAALLVAELQAAKIAEAKAIERRIKVTITGVVNRSIDPVMLAQVKAVMPTGLFDQAIRYKPDIILAGLRYLQNNEPEAYGLLAQAITAKPGKTQVKVEPIATATDEE